MNQKCRICGCTDDHACVTTEGACFWVDDDDLCSACAVRFGVPAFEAVIAERARQDQKWGRQDHGPSYWTGILGEEFGELCQAINETVFDNGAAERAKGGYANMRREAVQVAAVAVAFVEYLDRRYNGKSND